MIWIALGGLLLLLVIAIGGLLLAITGVRPLE
jgi:hypothetical protein